MLNKFSNASSETPEKKLAFLRKMQQELDTYGPIMSAYERITVGDEVKRMREEYYPAITNAVISKHNQALEKVQAAKGAINQARANEINRWNPDTLRQNMQLYGELMTGIAKQPADIMRGYFPEDEIARLYQEAQESGDIFKQRAAAEIVRVLPLSGDQNARAKMAMLQGQARDTLQAIRETEQIQQAREFHNQAVKELVTVQGEVVEVGKLMGNDPTAAFSSGPYAQALRRAKFLPDGDIEILAADDQRVTGIAKFTIPEEVNNE